VAVLGCPRRLLTVVLKDRCSERTSGKAGIA